MRHTHSILKPVALCNSVLDQLVHSLQLTDWKQSVPARLLAQILLWATALGRSTSAICRLFRNAPSDESVRLALLAYLPPSERELHQRLMLGLHTLLPRSLRRRPQPMALDLHYRPYYGDPKTRGVVRGQPKAGTKLFFAYATLVVLRPGLRLTVGLVALKPGWLLTDVLEQLLRQARAAGVQPEYLLLDRGFYAGDVVQWLQRRHLPFVMPMIRRGNEAQQTGTQRFFHQDMQQGWYDYTWTARPRRTDPQTGKKRKTQAVTVTVRVCVVRRTRGRKPWAYLAHRVRWSPELVRKRYRSRFGIETSYRQLRQCVAKTTCRDRRVRLLLVGVALLVRQWWAYLHWEVLSGPRRGHRQLHPERLRLEDVKLWLHSALAEKLGLILEVQTQRSLPQVT